jgi:endonuclease/exonuclease/phosphatase family metal-dependent hydrolase
VKFVSYNIQFGIGLDGKFDPRRIADSIATADVIALQEVTRGFHRNGHADLVETFASLFPGYSHVYGPACDVFVDHETIDGRRRERRFQFGNMVLSRYPILSCRMLLLPRSRTFDKLNLQRCATEALIDAPGGPLRVYSVHLDHVSPNERIAQIRFLKERATNHLNEGGALTGISEFALPELPLAPDYLMLGDFNMEPESPEYVEMVGHDDAFYGRVARADQPLDAQTCCDGHSADGFSWVSPDGKVRKHLDYCFLSGGLQPRLKSARVDTMADGSDHFPLWVEID